MKIAGIVAEYNPFHKGHLHLIQTIRDRAGQCRADAVVVVMSGNFVQRGEPALLNKAERARMAVKSGADLVLELPLPYVLSSAEGFARGAVGILDALGCVDVLCFGSECADETALKRAADAMETERFVELMRYFMEEGISYPAARQKALLEVAGQKSAALLNGANNVLGIEYMRVLAQRESRMDVFTIPRIGAEHDALTPLGDIASASYIRRLVREGRLANIAPYMNIAGYQVLSAACGNGTCPSDVRLIERAVLAKLRLMSAEDIRRWTATSEGLENRFLNAIKQAQDLEQLISLTKTKRYPQTRIQRMIWSAFLEIPATYAQNKLPPYVRLLAVGEKGHDILNQARRGPLPLLSRVTQVERLTPEGQAWFEMECRASDLYGLALPKPPACGQECTYAVAHP